VLDIGLLILNCVPVKELLYSIQSTRVSIQSSKLGPPTPSHESKGGSPLGPKWGGATLACGEGGGGTQFRRLDRHSGTLYSNPFTVYTYMCDNIALIVELIIPEH
jgi:hypothetical protein